MDVENPAFTGFFNEGQKRIDIVIVLNEVDANESMQEIRLTFLMNLIKFGFELEVEIGKLPEHKDLLFVKVHAPDSIIEDFGLFFNERRFFKDDHIDLVHPYLNFIGINYERDLIKTIRNQYPGPGNYSTLERSMIVYKILLQLPFGQYENHYGIDKLMNSNVIVDAFALHDGPYFIVPTQEASEYINGRQVLFYNWVGFINIWKMQPIHMIKEYFGERVAFYFSYYEFFNIMLAIITVLGTRITIDQYNAKAKSDLFTRLACGKWPEFEPGQKLCGECLNTSTCPSLSHKHYCWETKFIARIDDENMFNFTFFVSIWGLLFVLLWKRYETYLMWIWEINKNCVRKLRRPEVLHYPSLCYKKLNLTALSMGYQNIFDIILRGLMILFTIALYCALFWVVLIISLQLCYFKHWYRYAQRRPNWRWKRDENKLIATTALMYTTVIFLLKIAVMIISYITTELERHDTFALYDRSLAIKMFGFNFLSTYCLMFCKACIGVLIYTNYLHKRKVTLENFGDLTNGLGTSFDDICIIIAVMVFLEQVIFKIPSILYYKMSDYDQLCVFDANVPCWEREYRLPNLNEIFIHNSYSALAMKFVMATLFSCTCPIVTLLILLVNVWDIRYKARRVLLWHRRPLLINTSGPGIWHRLILIAAHVIPVLNACLIILQSRYFLKEYGLKLYIDAWTRGPNDIIYTAHRKIKMTYHQGQAIELISPFYALIIIMCSSIEFCLLEENKIYDNTQLFAWWHLFSYRAESLIICEAFILAITILLHILLPAKTDDIRVIINKEEQIKQEFYVRKSFLGTYNSVH
ncbi:anoctamin-5-like [Vanessa cardui]|uniref:anoctamin-5-like n=1 Tax=Vanessa cardui TaxID=171605 RepID=UPI001F13FA1B|nr:anoctamin-5-like [Vanessa cardui]